MRADFGKSAGKERTQLVPAREIILFRAADNPRQRASLDIKGRRSKRKRVRKSSKPAAQQN